MKRFPMLIVLLLILSACSNETSTDDLTGTWKQTNANDEDSTMEAVIENDTITIDWIMDNGDSRAVYWVGTYDAPSEEVSEYSWTSEKDIDATQYALLASIADTKDFKYEEGELNFEFEMMGMQMTIRMELED